MKPLRRLLLLGVSAHLLIAGTVDAQPATIPVDVISDWSWYHSMGWQAFRSGDYETAAYRFGMAIEKLRPYQKFNQKLLVRTYHDMSWVLYTQKRYADAEPLAKWVVDVRKADPKVKADALFDGLYLLAMIRREQDHNAQAEPLFYEALQVEEKAVGPNDIALTSTLYDLAAVEFKLEKYDRAELHLRRALAIYKGFGQTQSPGYVDTLERYAKVLDQLDRGDDARVAEEAVERLRAELARKKEQPARSQFRPSFGGVYGDLRPVTP
jgi:tetratricopeptide (TPR) repeat protein